MSWIAALKGIQPQRIILRKDGARMPDTSREVVIDGVRYPSMQRARLSLECSYSVIYRLIGEAWRYDKRGR